MSRDESASLTIPPPIVSVDTIILASAASSAALKIPEAWRNGWITIEPDGVTCYVGFSHASATTVDQTAVSTITSNAVSAHGTGECLKIPDGAVKHFDMARVAARKEVDLFLIHKESATGGYVRISRSSGYANQVS